MNGKRFTNVRTRIEAGFYWTCPECEDYYNRPGSCPTCDRPVECTECDGSGWTTGDWHGITVDAPCFCDQEEEWKPEI